MPLCSVTGTPAALHSSQMLQSHTGQSIAAGFHLARLSLGASSAALFFSAVNMSIHYRVLRSICQANRSGSFIRDLGKITLPNNPLDLLILIEIIRKLDKDLLIIADRIIIMDRVIAVSFFSVCAELIVA